MPKRKKQARLEHPALDVVSVGDIVVAYGRFSKHAGGLKGESSANRWILVTEFDKWKLETGETLECRIRIEEREVTERQLHNRMKKYQLGEVRKFRFRIEQHPARGLLGLLVKDLGKGGARDLSGARRSKKKTVSVKSEMGTFRLDRSTGSYYCDAKWIEGTARFTLDPDTSDELADALNHALRLWKQQKTWNQRTRKFIVDELLETANNWLTASDLKSVTPSQFRKRIALKSVSVDPEGGLAFWFIADGTFGEHGISVHGSMDGGVVEAVVS